MNSTVPLLFWSIFIGYGKRIDSGALMADAWHHRSDELSSVGALVGIGRVYNCSEPAYLGITFPMSKGKAIYGDFATSKAYRVMQVLDSCNTIKIKKIIL